MRRTILTPVIVAIVLGFVALFAVSALLPGPALVILLMVGLFVSFAVVAWKSREE